MVRKSSEEGTGELCGLWNTREVAGYGIGAFFATRVGVVIAEQLGIKSIWALCAPYTVKFAERVGCVVVKELGNNGTFYYPKIDLLATAVMMEDAWKMTTADPYEISRITDLRKNLVQTAIEIVPFGKLEVEIEYNLILNNIIKDEFKISAEKYTY